MYYAIFSGWAGRHVDALYGFPDLDKRSYWIRQDYHRCFSVQDDHWMVKLWQTMNVPPDNHFDPYKLFELPKDAPRDRMVVTSFTRQARGSITEHTEVLGYAEFGGNVEFKFHNNTRARCEVDCNGNLFVRLYRGDTKIAEYSADLMKLGE